MDEIDRRGGMVEALRSGYVQKRIGERAYEHQRALDSGATTVVGVNKFATGAKQDVEVHRVSLDLEREQAQRLHALKLKRDEASVARALEKLVVAAKSDDNLMPYIAEAVRAYATVGEITGALRRVFGTYVPPEF
jgi:methylmalonyl-CoA mutase N-terminal domain/subunit